MTLDVLYSTLCSGVFWSCFCRLVRTNDATHWVARFGFFALGAAALAGVVSPWIWGTRVEWPAVGMAAGILILQAFTARAWQHGVPEQFQWRSRHGL